MSAREMQALNERVGLQVEMIDRRNAEIESLKQKLQRYRAAMENVCDELGEDFDTVDGGDGQPAPNKAMRLANELKEAIYGPGGF